jgi:hypothetical protein
MTNRMEQRSRGRAPRIVGFAVFALLVLSLPGAALAQWATNGTNISNTNSGGVGIGTADPSQGGAVTSKFTVATSDDLTVFATSNGTLPRFALNNHGDGSWTMHDYVGNRWNIGITQQAGNLGVGTTRPASLLDIRKDVPYALGPILTLSNGSGGANSGGAIDFSHSGLSVPQQARIQSVDDNNYSASLAFFTKIPGAAPNPIVERMRITSAGQVGIGTGAPTAKLHVAGDIKVDGNINAKYQDVAEWVPSTQRLSAGTVVVLDSERPNHVLASTIAYDTAVAGVISARPGLTLGEAGEGKALVATTGRVKVKVDASRAPIKIGDLIVTSEIPGVAMRSEPVSVGGVSMHRPGTIVGKALESLVGGTGEILVLLSLQ